MALTGLDRAGMQRAFVFAVSAAVAATLCYLGDGLTYLAPFMATAAVLANAGAILRKACVATVVVYLISLLVGTVGSMWLPATPSTVVLCCTVGFLLCVSTAQQHPPALALLAVVFIRQPALFNLLWLGGTALAIATMAAIANQASLAVLSKRAIGP